MIGAKQHHGFTLIELLITAAIFSLAALLATTVFSNVQRTQRRTQNQQRINADGRYVLETIARSIRTGSINYAQIDSSLVLPSPTTSISTVDQTGVITCYQWNAANKTVEVANNAPSNCATGITWTPFTPDDLIVNNLNFFVFPLSDPFRPVPRSSTDCAVSYANGSCTCMSSGDCFSDQVCTVAGGGKICTNPNTQPHVTINISTTSKTGGTGEKATSKLQTTVVSRIYQ